jgi:hypothetical protein
MLGLGHESCVVYARFSHGWSRALSISAVTFPLISFHFVVAAPTGHAYACALSMQRAILFLVPQRLSTVPQCPLLGFMHPKKGCGAPSPKINQLVSFVASFHFTFLLYSLHPLLPTSLTPSQSSWLPWKKVSTGPTSLLVSLQL